MIAVLGRGSSLEKYREHHKLFDKLYIVNNFDVEIEMLGPDIFDGKEIIQVVGTGPVELTKKHYKRIGVKHVQFNRRNIKYLGNKKIPVPVLPLPTAMLSRGFPTMGWNVYLGLISSFDTHQEMCDYVDETYAEDIVKNIKQSHCHRAWPTTGLLAIDLALIENFPEEVYLFGFDMYETDYMVKNNRPYQNPGWDKSKVMKYYLEVLVKEFKDTKFYNSSPIIFEETNWINI